MIYTQRKEVLAGENIRGTVESILDETIEDIVASFCPEKTPAHEWNWEGLFMDFGRQFNFAAELPAADTQGLSQAMLTESLRDQVKGMLAARTEEFGEEVMEHRITSYNVCYTKLLRPHVCHDAIGVLAAVTVGTACVLDGSVTAGIAVVAAGHSKKISVEHPTGEFSVRNNFV